MGVKLEKTGCPSTEMDTLMHIVKLPQSAACMSLRAKYYFLDFQDESGTIEYN